MSERTPQRPTARRDERPVLRWSERQARSEGSATAPDPTVPGRMVPVPAAHSTVPAAPHPGLDEASARRWIAETAREIYLRKLSGATDGNLSIRLRNGLIATTPSGVHKGRLTDADIVVVDPSGQPVGKAKLGRNGQPLRPSSEIALHTAAYRLRPDIGAVVHAHPPMAIAYGLAGGDLSQVLVSEVIFACGTIATAPYSTPTTQAVPDVLGPYLRCYDVVMMHRHGSVTLGVDLDQAMARLDALEHTALIYCTAKMMGGAAPIPGPEVERLYGLARPDAPWRADGNSCPVAAPQPSTAQASASQTSTSQSALPAVDERLVAAVVAALRGGPTPPSKGGACQ